MMNRETREKHKVFAHTQFTNAGIMVGKSPHG